MKIYILIFISVLTVQSCRSQANNLHYDTMRNVRLIDMPAFYSERGVIFSKTYQVATKPSGMEGRFTPSDSDLVVVEKMLTHLLEQKKLKEGNVNFKKFIRQYIGFLDKYGHKNILVQLLNNTNHKKLQKIIGDNWRHSFVLQLSDAFYEVSRIYMVNLDNGSISDQF